MWFSHLFFTDFKALLMGDSRENQDGDSKNLEISNVITFQGCYGTVFSSFEPLS